MNIVMVKCGVFSVEWTEFSNIILTSFGFKCVKFKGSSCNKNLFWPILLDNVFISHYYIVTSTQYHR
jgi:hypothetical protein